MSFQNTLSTRLTSSTFIIFVLMMGVGLPKSVLGDQNKKAADEVPKASVPQTDAFQKLIQEVKQNEKLYTDLYLKLTSVYEKLPRPTDINKQIKTETEISIDIQEKKFRFEAITTGRRIIQLFLPPKKLSSHEVTGTSEVISVFNGNTHYRLWLNDLKPDKVGKKPGVMRSGEISDEAPIISNFARPHMFLGMYGGPHVPLSTFLEGARAITAYPGSNADMQNLFFEKQILGTEKFQGLQCIKIQMKLIGSNGKPHSRHEIWLAKNRNLFPVHRLRYSYHWSKIIPIEESTVDDWKELHPGVWFPMKGHSKHYNSLSKKPRDKKELTWRRQYDVKRITLDPPQRASDVFTKLDFPKGIPIRDFKNDEGNRLKIHTEKIKKYLDKARSQE